MREVADAGRIRRFMRAFGCGAGADGRVYFTGGATAYFRRVEFDVYRYPAIDLKSFRRRVVAVFGGGTP